MVTPEAYWKPIGRVLSPDEDCLRLCKAGGWRIAEIHEQHARRGNRLQEVTILGYLQPFRSTAE